MKTLDQATEYISNKIKEICAGRPPIKMVNASKIELKAIQKFDIIRNRALAAKFDGSGMVGLVESLNSCLDPYNHEPGSPMYVAAQDVLNYINS